jgi:dienelactone hydrolase
VSVAARLIDVRIPDRPEGVVLVLHGGGSRGAPVAVSPTQLSVLRMIPVAREVAQTGQGRLAVLRLLNSFRGWDSARTPVADVRWALGQLAERLGAEVPVCLVGHSLGGRAALLSADQPAVRGVVALAPWVYPDDVVHGVAGTPIVIIHGEADRIAAPARARQVADALRRETSVSYVTVAGGTHAMLSRRSAFDGLAARCAAWMLLGDVDDPVLERVAAGEPSVTV